MAIGPGWLKSDEAKKNNLCNVSVRAAHLTAQIYDSRLHFLLCRCTRASARAIRKRITLSRKGCSGFHQCRQECRSCKKWFSLSCGALVVASCVCLSSASIKKVRKPVLGEYRSHYLQIMRLTLCRVSYEDVSDVEKCGSGI